MTPHPRTSARRPMVPLPPPVRGRVFIRVERCKGCEFCVEFCPQHVLKMSAEFNPKGFHFPVVAKDECINCNLCVSLCPDYAIYSRRLVRRPLDPAGHGPGPNGVASGGSTS